MSDEITPALSADEWDARAVHDGSGAPTDDGIVIDAQGEPPIFSITPVVPEPDGGWRVGLGERQRLDVERLPALIALANAALPDDSAYKITRADVAAIRRHQWKYSEGSAWWREINTIADKLAALLPPQADTMNQ